MTVLCSGGAGFIGSHLIERLLTEGHRVVCFDNFDNFYNPVLKWRNLSGFINNPSFQLVTGNVTDIQSLEKAFGCWGINSVVHLAAQAGVRPSVQNPSHHANVNITGTVNILELCKKYDVKKFVFASSSSVYGNNPNVPWKETESTDEPLCVYAASKKAGELICHTYHHLYGIDTAIIRPFTVYGPRQRIEMAIPLFTDAIYHKREITIFGDGSTQRDYTYVDDVVSGIMVILAKEHGFEVYNLASSRPVSIKELLYAIEARLKRSATIKYSPIGAGEANMTYADITKAQSIGYHPQYTIYEGLDHYVNWYLKEKESAV